MKRVLNSSTLTDHGNIQGRRDIVKIIDAGLDAANPYTNTSKAFKREGSILTVGGKAFETVGDPKTGLAKVDLADFNQVLVIGAGKGIQYSAKAIEDVLGEYLTGGEVIEKHGTPHILEKIHVNYGAHPVPDQGCIDGCNRILKLVEGLTEKDLVITVVGNGVSSLLTLPVPGVTLEDIREVTYNMQITKGAPTHDLNYIRNNLDVMKGGKITKRLQPAKSIHIIVSDPLDWPQLIGNNFWLHTLPDCTSYETAIDRLKKWEAWDESPASVRDFLTKADPAYKVLSEEEWHTYDARVFGVMPKHMRTIEAAKRKAEELGYTSHTLLNRYLAQDAPQMGKICGGIAMYIEEFNEPFKAPCAIFASGEMVVTVGNEKGMGGRNQEFALATALEIAGSDRVVIGSVDTDGTDGPGKQFTNEYPDVPVLGGGIVDGYTVHRAEEKGIDIFNVLKTHNASPNLWEMGDGVVVSPNVSLGDLTVILVREPKVEEA